MAPLWSNIDHKRAKSMKSLEDIVEFAKRNPSQKVAVVAPEDPASLEAISEAIKADIVEAIFVGNQPIIEDHMKKLGISNKGIDFEFAADHITAAKKAVALIKNGDAALLMKGTLHTEDILRAVLDKNVGLRDKPLLSHTLVFESPVSHKLTALTDAAMNIAPDFVQKAQILENAAELMRKLTGLQKVKAAALAAVETVNPKMQATVDAAYLSKMSQRGQIKNVIVDGPLALDNAMRLESAQLKGIKSEVAGDPDILLVPAIESGNMLYKFMTVICGIKGAGIILGAAAPIILTSRADEMETKLNSIALGAIATLKKG